ncbi:MAG: hypothetical protein ACE5J2_07585 [Nitrososphaerales archaeon]
MGYKATFALSSALMLLLSGTSLTEAYATHAEEKEVVTRSGEIVEVRYFCLEEQTGSDIPEYCEDIGPGKFRVGQTVYASVTIKNTDQARGTYFIEFSAVDELHNTWLGEEIRASLSPREENTYAVGWTVVDEAPIGDYSGRVVLYGETIETGGELGTKVKITKTSLDSRIEPDAFGVILAGEGYFIANILDKELVEIEPPLSLNILEKFAVDAKSFTLSVTTLPAKFTVPWLTIFKKDTALEITALKEGYKQSEPYLFIMPGNPPSSGKLFEHTFILEKEFVKMKNGKEEPVAERGVQSFVKKISFDGKEYATGIVTTSNVQVVTLDQPLKRLIVDIEEDERSGSANITMPKTLIGGPFTVNRSNVVFTQNATHSSIYLEYDTGMQTIEITGSSVVPEFPLGSSFVIIASISMVVIFGILIGRKRSTYSLRLRE